MVLDAAKAINALLPQGWDVAYSLAEDDRAVDAGYDASIVVRAPDGQVATFLTEIKIGRVAGAEQVLMRLYRTKLETGREILLVAPYIGPALRDQCERQGINYLDLMWNGPVKGG